MNKKCKSSKSTELPFKRTHSAGICASSSLASATPQRQALFQFSGQYEGRVSVRSAVRGVRRVCADQQHHDHGAQLHCAAQLDGDRDQASRFVLSPYKLGTSLTSSLQLTPVTCTTSSRGVRLLACKIKVDLGLPDPGQEWVGRLQTGVWSGLSHTEQGVDLQWRRTLCRRSSRFCAKSSVT